jgi:hypothetical protein
MIETMRIVINSETRLSDFIRTFGQTFPFLKIEIFKKGKEMSHTHIDYRLFDLANKKSPSGFEIFKSLKVIELEQLFWNNLGIQISVFRKMGNSVFETSYTSDWTLDHQNQKGAQLVSTI